MGQQAEKRNRGMRLEIRRVWKQVFGNVFIAIRFGIGISGASEEITKTVFPLYFRGKLGDACHYLFKKTTGVHQFTACVFPMYVRQDDLQC